MHYNYTIFDLVVDHVPPVDDATDWLKKTIGMIGVEIRESAFHEFESPVSGAYAYTAMFVLAESHAVIHTAPEDHWVECVFALCKDVDRMFLREAVVEFWRPERIYIRVFTTGVGNEDRPAGEHHLSDEHLSRGPDLL